MMGPETLVQIMVGGQEISMLVDESQAFDTDGHLNVTFRPDRMHLFDGSSEQRLH